MEYQILNNIEGPENLKALSLQELQLLAKELRQYIIAVVAVKEGHLGASLGVVELTIALHFVFDTPRDLLVWDVGHQAYGHKILTGRRKKFHTNRQLGGISGFPKREESVYDAFGVGHSSTSISAALGMALASRLKGDLDKQHIAVIGDASIASGMAFEGLNHAGVTNANLLVILNDNAIGIDPSVGALKEYLTKAKVGYKPKESNIIEALNFRYFGPIDGHDLEGLLSILKELNEIKGPKFLHVITKKGKGLKKAEEDQVKYHAPGKFKPETGELLPKSAEGLPLKYQDVFGLTLVELAEKNKSIVGITPAMPTGSSLKYMMEAFPERAFDVGIAEQQRAYDQVIHDVALQNLPVIFCLDRAGLVGEDGATHHGLFDLVYLRAIPNMIVVAPADEIELRQLLYTAQLGLTHPMAIRYPRGRGVNVNWQLPFKALEIGKAVCEKEGENLAVLVVGSIIRNAKLALQEFSEEIGLYNMRFVKPLDRMMLHQVFKKYKTILTIEDGVISGGFGSAILEFAAANDYSLKIKCLGIPDAFIEHGEIGELQEIAGIDVKTIINELKSLL